MSIVFDIIIWNFEKKYWLPIYQCQIFNRRKFYYMIVTKHSKHNINGIWLQIPYHWIKKHRKRRMLALSWIMNDASKVVEGPSFLLLYNEVLTIYVRVFVTYYQFSSNISDKYTFRFFFFFGLDRVGLRHFLNPNQLFVVKFSIQTTVVK